MASAIPSCRTLENFSGENQNAASFDRFADGFMHWVYRSSLSNAFVAMVNDFTFCGFICLANDTDWSVAWSQNARADMDQRDYANQAGSTGHDHFIWWFYIYGTVVCRIYASAWMDVWVLWVYQLFCGCKFVFISFGVPVVTGKRCYTFCGSVIGKTILAHCYNHWWRCKRNPLFNATGMDMDDFRLHITF